MICSISHSSVDDVDNTLSFSLDVVSFVLKKVEKGTFCMGNPHPDDVFDNELPATKVALTNDYYLAQHLVTQDLWYRVMGNNPSYFGAGGNGTYLDNYGSLPVESVSWLDCQEFIEKLNRMLQNQLSGKRFRLPTEAEWEFAAKGGNFSSNFDFNVDEMVWYDKNSNNQTHPVGMRTPNPLGLFDMCGNVWEWCQDSFSSFPGGECEDYLCSANNNIHVGRGAGWTNNLSYCHLSVRYGMSDIFTSNDLGFRLCLS